MKRQSEQERLREVYAQRQARFAGTDRYTATNAADRFGVEQRRQRVLQRLQAEGCSALGDLSLLEVGCGNGNILSEFADLGAEPSRMAGVDLRPEALLDIPNRAPGFQLSCADGRELPFASSRFDLVLQYTAMSSILSDEIRRQVAAEMLRVLNPQGGLILWYDFWTNPTNRQTRGIRPAEIRGLFPGCRYVFERITLAPPLARRMMPISIGLATWLEKTRLLNSHILAVISPTP
jgi:SAM-dependent methyltransferase